LMVGDSLTSDIAAGNNAGFATCWFNRHGTEVPASAPTMTVGALHEILTALSPE